MASSPLGVYGMLNLCSSSNAESCRGVNLPLERTTTPPVRGVSWNSAISLGVSILKRWEDIRPSLVLITWLCTWVACCGVETWANQFVRQSARETAELKASTYIRNIGSSHHRFRIIIVNFCSGSCRLGLASWSKEKAWCRPHPLELTYSIFRHTSVETGTIFQQWRFLFLFFLSRTIKKYYQIHEIDSFPFSLSRRSKTQDQPTEAKKQQRTHNGYDCALLPSFLPFYEIGHRRRRRHVHNRA